MYALSQPAVVSTYPFPLWSSKKILSINVLLTMCFYEVQCFKRMWYSEELYQELNGSDGHPYNVSRLLLMRHTSGCPFGPACTLWERQGRESEAIADLG